MGFPRIMPASAVEVHGIWSLRREREDWLAERGIDQWPVGDMTEKTIAGQVSRGEWHVMHDDDGAVAAALRVLWEDPDYWPDRPEESVFVHGLMVGSSLAGRGAGGRLLDEATAIGAARGARWLRLDCPADSEKLMAYYASRGFQRVGLRRSADSRLDVVLWCRPIPRP